MLLSEILKTKISQDMKRFKAHRAAWREEISQQCCSCTDDQLRARSTIAATSSSPKPKWWLTV